ncbi:putative bifunctional UDP-N-acetylglucosamine transferase and deubiquitinase ALG13 isoform X37 [Danio rerio]|uniref:Bifunctional UDP-N-acetylglucosamine transferase and deubiquitinase ALG13 isoform X37 n=1 Tax=Danio rerio TaxID=7955 RepID=A0AC58I9B4_DANRE
MQKALKKYFVSMDEYLASIGLYRKMMARDASCLFRAVSEQLYYSQNYHQRIRKECVNFIRANRCNFEPFVEGSFEKYLERLEDPKETVGQVIIKALSLLYRRCFVIYRYPGKPPTEIAEEDNLPKILLCCSNNGHYDIVYPKSYPVDAAVCQALLYELLYTRVLGVEEDEIQAALEGFKGGGRRYRNSHSMCSEDASYDTPEDRSQSDFFREDWESRGHCRFDDRPRVGAEDQKVTEGSGKLALPYKVLKALEPELYRNVEFDVWQDSRKELQKTDYMVFAGRQYFLGDKCQVRLDPKGKYYNAFIQEVGTHSTAVTVFIEELGEKHLVSLTNLKPVNPVPAWNITPSRKGNSYSHAEQYPGELDPELRGRRRFFKKPRGVHSPAPPPPGLIYEHYRPHPPPRQPRGYGPPRSSARFLNRHHLIGPDMAYYPSPSKRCYQSFDNYSFRSRRSRRQMHTLNKECLSCVPEPGEETQDMEGSITFYELEETDEGAFSPISGQAVSSPMVPGATAYWVPRVPSPIPPSGKQAMTSSEEDPDERSAGGDQGEYSEEYIYSAAEAGYQSPSVYAAAAESTTNLTIQEGSSRAGSPQEGVATYSYSQQTPPNSLQPNNILTPGQLPPGRPAVPWFVNELGEPVAMAPPPPYSYDPNGSDLPRDCKVLQYYYNLGVQWYQQSYWHSMVHLQQVYPHQAADAQFQSYQSTAPPADHTVPQAYPDSVRMCPHPQGDMPSNGAPLGMENPPTVVPGTVFYPVVQEQCGQPALHSTYDPYMPVLSTTYHYLTPWTPGAAPHSRFHHTTYCPSSSHPPVNYITAPGHPNHLPHSQFV